MSLCAGTKAEVLKKQDEMEESFSEEESLTIQVWIFLMLQNMLHVSIHNWTTSHFLYILIDTCLATK